MVIIAIGFGGYGLRLWFRGAAWVRMEQTYIRLRAALSPLVNG